MEQLLFRPTVSQARGGEDRRKRNGFPSKPTHGPQKSSSHSGFGIWLFRAGCCMCQCPVTRRNSSESPTNHDLSNKDRCVCARTSCKHWTISIVPNSRFPHRDQSRLSPCIGAEIIRTLRAVSHNKGFFFFACLFLFIFSTVVIFFFRWDTEAQKHSWVLSNRTPDVRAQGPRASR